MKEDRFLRKIIRLGDSIAITLLAPIARKFEKSTYVWVQRDGDTVTIKEARVE